MARGKSLKWSHRPTSFLRAQFFSLYRKPPAPSSFRNIAVGNASWARGAAIYSSSLADYTWFSAVDMRRLQTAVLDAGKIVRWLGVGEIFRQLRLREYFACESTGTIQPEISYPIQRTRTRAGLIRETTVLSFSCIQRILGS